ncbi:SPX domain-containing protein [Choanephora cucurbitarum]|nr:SPX domain-containing protein [Choanephora cucurbitarum]
MKFAKYLESESIPEWRKAYINYKGLKKRLKAIEKLRKLNQIEESIHFADHSFQRRHDFQLPDDLPRSQPRIPRQRSSILDDRLRSSSQGTQPNLLQRLSSRFRKQETELDKFKVSRSFVSTIESQPATILEEALRHANEPEQYFFIMLDQDLETISRFYDEKETEAKAKYEALEMQVQLIHDFATHLTQMDVSHDIDGLNPIHWFRRRGSSDTNIVSENVLPPTVKYTGDHHVSYNVARSRLKKAITEYYRSLELLKSYKVLNATGFQKILKKFDKTAGWKASGLYMQKVNQHHWMRSVELDKLLHDTEMNLLMVIEEKAWQNLEYLKEKSIIHPLHGELDSISAYHSLSWLESLNWHLILSRKRLCLTLTITYRSMLVSVFQSCSV